MHVALNLVFLTPGEQGGMETYARQLIPELAKQEGVRLTSLVNTLAAEEGGPWADAGEQIVVDVDARQRTEWVRAEQQLVPQIARRARFDLVHSLASTAPLWGGPVRVTTIHDLNYKLVPDTHFGLRGLGMRLLVPAAARRSHRIIVDAASTRGDLERHLGIARDKVDVVPLAAAPATVSPTPGTELRNRLALGSRRVVLSPSAKRPHKNIEGLLDALAGLDPATRPLLVVPGYPTPHEKSLADRASRLGMAADVRMPGWLSTQDLEGLYGMAECVVFPSRYEGFGLPVLEAMGRGVAVACSNTSSLPEVAGDAALLFDPEDVGQIRAALHRLLEEPGLAADLAGRGRLQAAKFSWQQTAVQTAASYRRALDPAWAA